MKSQENFFQENPLFVYQLIACLIKEKIYVINPKTVLFRWVCQLRSLLDRVFTVLNSNTSYKIVNFSILFNKYEYLQFIWRNILNVFIAIERNWSLPTALISIIGLKMIGINLECLPELVPRLIQFFVPSLLEQKHQDNVSFQK